MTNLIERIESAEGPSRELDVEIAWAVGGINAIGQDILWPSGFRIPCPRYTASIDAALTLVPEGLIWEVRYDPRLSRGLVMDQDGFNQHHTVAATPALAICTAALRARGEPA